MTVNQGKIIQSYPRVILRLWYESPKDQEFTLHPSKYENIESWVHEFTELAIWNTFYFKNNICTHHLNNAVCIKLKNGEIRRYTPCHILTSLHTISLSKQGFFTPDEFTKIIFEERMPCPGFTECSTSMRARTA